MVLKSAATIAVFLFAGLISFAIWGSPIVPEHFDSLGEFGDFVGGIGNPLLALIGLLALLFTIKLQLNELSLSREELSMTREELERSATALEHQVAQLEKQRLSQAFFDLFEMYKSVVAEIEYGTGEDRYIGKAALAKHAGRYHLSYSGSHTWRLEDVKERHAKSNDNLGNYYRMIFRMLLFLSENGKAAEFYADMFRAQLSTRELHLLFLNCVSDVGKPMQTYANVFELFDNMPIPPGSNFEVIANELDVSSFGKNSELIQLITDDE